MTTAAIALGSEEARVQEIAAILAEGVWRVLCADVAPEPAISSPPAVDQAPSGLDVAFEQSVHGSPTRRSRRERRRNDRN